METPKTLMKADMQAVAELTCAANGCAELASKIDFKWSHRIVASTGAADLRTSTVKLSRKVLQAMSYDQQLEAVAREVCHLITWHLYQDTSHHHAWQHCMRKAGYPEAMRVVKLTVPATVKRRKYKRENSPYEFGCACRKGLKLHPVVARNIVLKGQLRVCKTCGQAYELLRNKNAQADLRLESKS